MPQRRRAVVLLSGGLDSATTLAIARGEGFDCHALSVDYGQRHDSELAAARRVAESLGAVEHRIVKVDLRAIGGSALTDDTIPVPTSTASLRGRHRIRKPCATVSSPTLDHRQGRRFPVGQCR